MWQCWRRDTCTPCKSARTCTYTLTHTRSTHLGTLGHTHFVRICTYTNKTAALPLVVCLGQPQRKAGWLPARLPTCVCHTAMLLACACACACAYVCMSAPCAHSSPVATSACCKATGTHPPTHMRMCMPPSSHARVQIHMRPATHACRYKPHLDVARRCAPAAHGQARQLHGHHPHSACAGARQVRRPHSRRGRLWLLLLLLLLGVGLQGGQPCHCCEGALAAEQQVGGLGDLGSRRRREAGGGGRGGHRRGGHVGSSPCGWRGDQQGQAHHGVQAPEAQGPSLHVCSAARATHVHGLEQRAGVCARMHVGGVLTILVNQGRPSTKGDDRLPKVDLPLKAMTGFLPEGMGRRDAAALPGARAVGMSGGRACAGCHGKRTRTRAARRSCAGHAGATQHMHPGTRLARHAGATQPTRHQCANRGISTMSGSPCSACSSADGIGPEPLP